MAGEWQVTSQRIIAPEGEGEKKPEAIGFGVRKRAVEDEDEEALQSKKGKWGSAYRNHPELGKDDDDLDALLNTATAPKASSSFLKQESASIKEEAPKFEPVDSSALKADPDETPSIKTEPAHDDPLLLPENPTVPTAEIKQEDGEASGGIVFKKRKAKNIRQK